MMIWMVSVLAFARGSWMILPASSVLYSHKMSCLVDSWFGWFLCRRRDQEAVIKERLRLLLLLLLLLRTRGPGLVLSSAWVPVASCC